MKKPVIIALSGIFVLTLLQGCFNRGVPETVPETVPEIHVTILSPAGNNPPVSIETVSARTIWNGAKFKRLPISKIVLHNTPAAGEVSTEDTLQIDFGRYPPETITATQILLNADKTVNSTYEIPYNRVSKQALGTLHVKDLAIPNRDQIQQSIVVLDVAWGQNQCEYAFLVQQNT